jgi:hypothetical protein
MMKKILIGLFLFIAVVIGALLLIPQFYSIDRFRPQIVEAINKQVGGSVSIEKLDFRLFPSFRFRMKGLKATQPGFQSETWMELTSLDADIALWSLLVSPKATLIIKEPKFTIQKGSEGTFNFEDFLANKKGNHAARKSETTGTSTPPPAETAQTPAPTTPSPTTEATGDAAPPDIKAILDGLPSFIRNTIYKARFAVAVLDGSVTLADPTLLKGSDKIALSKMTLRLKNIGLDTPMAMESNVGFDVAFGDIKLQGPFTGTGTLQIVPVAKGLKLKLDLDESFDQADLRFSNLFRKASGRALGAKVAGEVNMVDSVLAMTLSNLELRLDQTRLGGTVKLQNLSADSMGDVDVKLEAKDVDLGGFGVLVPMVADYKLIGKTDLSISAIGSTLDPALLMTIELRGVGGSTPELQRPLKNLAGRIRISGTPKSPIFLVGPLTMGLGSSDIAFDMSAKGLNPSIVDMKVNSGLIDADELLGLEKLRLDAPAKKGKSAPVTEAPPPTKGKKGKPAPLDESLAAMAPVVNETLKNPALDMAQLNFEGNIKQFVALGADFENIQSHLTYKNRILKMDKAQLSAYGGKLNANLELGLKKDGLSYNFSSGLDGVNFEEVLGTHMPSWKNVLSGSMTGSASLSGKGLMREELEKNLRGALSGKVLDGSFDLPLLTIIDTLSDSMPKMSKFAKSAGVDVSKAAKGERAKGAFKTMDIDAKIVGREVILEKMEIEYDPKFAGGQLIFKAKGTVDFDQKIALTGTLLADPKILKLEEAKALIGKSGLAEVPMKIKGTIEQPQPDYAYTLEYVGKKLLGDKALDVAAKGIEKVVGKDAAVALGDALSDPKKMLNKKTQKKLGKGLKKLFK